MWPEPLKTVAGFGFLALVKGLHLSLKLYRDFSLCRNLSLSLFISLSLSTCIYILYMYRDRDRERERDRSFYASLTGYKVTSSVSHVKPCIPPTDGLLPRGGLPSSLGKIE